MKDLNEDKCQIGIQYSGNVKGIKCGISGSIDILCNFENIRYGCSEGNGGCMQY